MSSPHRKWYYRCHHFLKTDDVPHVYRFEEDIKTYLEKSGSQLEDPFIQTRISITELQTLEDIAFFFPFILFEEWILIYIYFLSTYFFISGMMSLFFTTNVKEMDISGFCWETISVLLKVCRVLKLRRWLPKTWALLLSIQLLHQSMSLKMCQWQ